MTAAADTVDTAPISPGAIGTRARTVRPIAGAGVLLGAGLGAFVDGILFHQVLQTHSMLSARRPPDTLEAVEINMVYDGLFHALALLLVLAGVIALHGAGRRRDASWSGRALLGGGLLGWGLFNLVEGTLNHHVLGLHHVVERLGPSVYDVLFLAFGAALAGVGGWMLVREERRLARGGVPA